MIREATFALSDQRYCQDAIARVRVGDEVGLRREASADRAGVIWFVGGGGGVLGFAGPDSWASGEVGAGRLVLSTTIDSKKQRADGDLSITIKMVTGEEGDSIAPPPAPPKVYSVNVSGESYRQEEIARTRVGEAVRLIPDPTNPYDDRAIAVWTWRRDQIGFLPMDGWLTDVILDEGREVYATVATIAKPSGGRRHAAVILKVILL